MSRNVVILVSRKALSISHHEGSVGVSRSFYNTRSIYRECDRNDAHSVTALPTLLDPLPPARSNGIASLTPPGLFASAWLNSTARCFPRLAKSSSILSMVLRASAFSGRVSLS